MRLGRVGARRAHVPRLGEAVEGKGDGERGGEERPERQVERRRRESAADGGGPRHAADGKPDSEARARPERIEQLVCVRRREAAHERERGAEAERERADVARDGGGAHERQHAEGEADAQRGCRDADAHERAHGDERAEGEPREAREAVARGAAVGHSGAQPDGEAAAGERGGGARRRLEYARQVALHARTGQEQADREGDLPP
eukprot:2916002-Prymnesium_polylepis.1